MNTIVRGESSKVIDAKPRLFDEIRNVARMRHLSLRTEQAYVQWIRRFILFHDKRHPREMGEAEIREFISHLAVERNITASTQTVALSALFFSTETFLRRTCLTFPTLKGHKSQKDYRSYLAVMK